MQILIPNSKFISGLGVTLNDDELKRNLEPTRNALNLRSCGTGRSPGTSLSIAKNSDGRLDCCEIMIYAMPYREPLSFCALDASLTV